MKSLVLGIGNVLLQDEGVGIHAIGELQRRFTFDDDVEFLDGGTAGVELLRYLDGKDRILIVDAVAAGHPPAPSFASRARTCPGCSTCGSARTRSASPTCSRRR